MRLNTKLPGTRHNIVHNRPNGKTVSVSAAPRIQPCKHGHPLRAGGRWRQPGYKTAF